MYDFSIYCKHSGPVAQRITRLTTDQKIPGSNPGRIDTFFILIFFINFYIIETKEYLKNILVKKQVIGIIKSLTKFA